MSDWRFETPYISPTSITKLVTASNMPVIALVRKLPTALKADVMPLTIAFPAETTAAATVFAAETMAAPIALMPFSIDLPRFLIADHKLHSRRP